LIFVFLLSPDGRLPSPRWRWAVWVTVTGLCLHTLGTLSLHPADFEVGQRAGDRSVSEPLLAVGVVLVATGLVASAVSIAWRLRTAEDDLRRQLLWIASSAAFLAFGVVVILVVPMVQGEEGTWLAALPLKLAQLAVPLCVAVAVLRHRLVQIDLMVNRALVLALATGLVAVGYVVVVVVAGAAVGQGTTGFWPSLLATALVALAFQPIRRGVVRVADRLSFGAAAAPYEVLADFSRRVGDGPDPSDLLPAVAEAAAQAVGARRVVVLLRVDSAYGQSAVWPPTDDGPLTSGTEFAVVDGGERLGSITVEMPPGRPLRVRERRLLADLSDQAALAFRGARLTAELSGQVVRLSRRTDELAESRRRLVTAADAERSRLERAIAREVLLHLQPLPDRLRQLSSTRPGTKRPVDASSLEPLVESLNTALKALREITRGVFPAQLVRSGLPMALTSLLAQTGGARRLVVTDVAAGRRFDPRIEAAAYFCVVEAVHDLADPVVVVLDARADQLQLSVSGTDRGGLPVYEMRDRVEAAGGSVSITENGGRAVIDVRAPAASFVA
jgi:signal transduction histidine kinase